MYANNDDFLGHAHRKRQEIAKSIYGSYNVQEEISTKEDILKATAPDEEENDIEKGKKAVPIGTVSNGYKKVAEGKWQKVSEHHGLTKKEHQEKSKSRLERGNKHEANMHHNLSMKLDDKDYDDAHVEGSGKKKVTGNGAKHQASVSSKEDKKKESVSEKDNPDAPDGRTIADLISEDFSDARLAKMSAKKKNNLIEGYIEDYADEASSRQKQEIREYLRDYLNQD